MEGNGDLSPGSTPTIGPVASVVAGISTVDPLVTTHAVGG